MRALLICVVAATLLAAYRPPEQKIEVAAEGNAAGTPIDVAIAVDTREWVIDGPIRLEAKTGDQNSGGDYVNCDLGGQHRCPQVPAGFTDASTFTQGNVKTLQVRFVPDGTTTVRGRMWVHLLHK